jgi:hypothetical protein
MLDTVLRTRTDSDSGEEDQDTDIDNNKMYIRKVVVYPRRWSIPPSNDGSGNLAHTTTTPSTRKSNPKR